MHNIIIAKIINTNTSKNTRFKNGETKKLQPQEEEMLGGENIRLFFTLSMVTSFIGVEHF